MRHLPVLANGRDVIDRIEIPVPCTVSWDGMKGDETVRHCGECKQNVYNLASFTRSEALQLLTARSGRVCLRIFRRPDGTVLTSDCRERLRAARRRGVFVFAGVLMIVVWAQICAQVVGWMSLRRFMRGPVMGEAPAISEVAPLPNERMGLRAPITPRPMMGEPMPERELMGKPVPPETHKKVKPVKPTHERHLMGTMLPARELMGDVDLGSLGE